MSGGKAHEAQRLARAALTYLAEPGDPVMGALLRICTPAAIVAALMRGRPPVTLTGQTPPLAFPEEDMPGERLSPLLTGEAVGGDGARRPGHAVSTSETGPAGVAATPRSGGAAGMVHSPEGTKSSPATGAVCGAIPVALPPAPALNGACRRWAARLGEVPAMEQLDRWRRDGIRLVIPGDTEWPSQLSVLGDARPWGLWVRGNADVRYACLRSVSIVGTRAASAYGAHVCTNMAVELAERGWAVVSGGAYGIDGCAHRAALAAGGTTIAVLPCGVDHPYPRGHHELFRAVRAEGATVSEWPPGRTPTRPGFLVRNRVIAALSRGTVVVEAALRSGALSTARHARDQGRPLMAVPGPVTSHHSAGCHEIIREWGAALVTSASDVTGLLEFPSGGIEPTPGGPVLPRDQLDPVTSRVLEAIPARAGRGPARIAVAAGVDFDRAMTCLGALAAAGFVERCDKGWRLRPQRGRRDPPRP